MTGRARDGFVDEIRGVALLGIVLVNVPFFALSETGYTAASLATGWDRLAAFLTVAFAQAKFYLLFSFLFGYSLSYLLRSDDRDRRARFRRRLLALGGFGAVHAVFAFLGDILLLYAVIGTSMLWLVRWRDRSLLAFGVALLLGWLALLGVLGVSLETLEPASSVSVLSELDHALASGSFVDAARARLHAWPQALLFLGVLNGPAVWAMFAFGTVAGRHRLLAEPDRHRGFWQGSAVLGTLVGLPLALVSAASSVGGEGILLESVLAQRGVLLGFASAPPLSLAYVAALALLRSRWPRALTWAQAPGRMSLTGYLGESILLSLLFCGYGAGLYGQVGAATAALCGIAVWCLLDLFARAWLARFEQGPFETLMHRLIR